MEEYICYNGVFVKISQANLSVRNRSFLYGDGLFESIHANGTIPQFLDKHLKRLFHGMQLLKMNIPDFFNYEYIFKKIQGTLVRNKLFKGARVRLIVFRNEGGLYAPENNEISFIIDTAKLDSYKYVLNEKGFFVDIYPEIKKNINTYSSLKTTNALLYVLAAIFRQQYKLDECIILNEKDYVCESISSNIFIVKDDTIFTPPLSDGCVAGVMREVIIELLKNNGITVVDNYSIDIEALFDADEIFLTNSINGIRWVLGFQKRRYFSKYSKEISNLLNQTYIPD